MIRTRVENLSNTEVNYNIPVDDVSLLPCAIDSLALRDPLVNYPVLLEEVTLGHVSIDFLNTRDILINLPVPTENLEVGKIVVESLSSPPKLITYSLWEPEGVNITAVTITSVKLS